MADDRKRKSWQVPKYGASSEKDVHDFLKQNVDDGIEYLEASPGYRQLEESIRILSGAPTKELEEKQVKNKYSRVQVNRLKRNLREMVNALSEIRFNPAYHAKSESFRDFAVTLNNVAEFWYTDRFADLKIKGALQFAAIGPCGWLEILYHEIPGERGDKNIDLIPLPWTDVVMTGVPDGGDHQQAYTVTIIKDLPVYLAHATWPDHQKILVPDRETPKGWIDRFKEKITQTVMSVFDSEPEKSTAKNPTCRLYYQRVLDLSINKTKQVMKMGYEKQKNALGQSEEVETSWSYDVPYVGQMIPCSYDEHGQLAYRPASPSECRIFPGRRLLVGTDRDLIYDGPDWDWHGKIPIVKICADQWPFGEFSMVHDVANIHDTISEIDRIIHQTIRNRYKPSLLYNNRAIPRDKAKGISTEFQGERIGFNGQEVASGSSAIFPLLPKDFNIVEAYVEAFRKYLDDAEDHQMGVRNFENLSKLKMGAGAGGDFLDEALKGAGPIVKGISRDMERSIRDLADMFKYYVLQYMDTPQLLYIVGPDGITPVNIDYDPGNMVPSHLPWEKKDQRSVYSKMYRARWAAEHAKFIVMPGTLHEITQTKQQMMYLQLWRNGFPIDPWSLAEVLRLGDIGPKPEGATSKIDLWMAWQEIQLKFKLRMQQEAQGAMGDGGNAPNLGGKGGQRGTGGRPSSGQAPPQMASKDGGSRTTVKESR